MTADYEAPDPQIAEFVDRMNQEGHKQSARLKDATPDQAWLIAIDSTESQAARMEALSILFRHRDPRVSALQLQLLDDPDQQIWKSIFSTYRTDSSQLRSALHQRVLASDVQTASYAAIILARFNDESLLPVIQPWLHATEREWRIAAIASLGHFKSAGAQSILTTLWNDGWGDEEDRRDLATKLTAAGNLAAREHLTSVATAANDSWSVACATQIYFVDPRAGLKLMLHIFESGDLEAKQGIVGQVSSLLGHLPHVYTYDGLVEARQRVEQELASLDNPNERDTISKTLELQIAARKAKE